MGLANPIVPLVDGSLGMEKTIGKGLSHTIARALHRTFLVESIYAGCVQPEPCFCGKFQMRIVLTARAGT